LRTVFRFGLKNKKIPSDPLVDVTFKPKRDPHKRRLPFSPDDRKLILKEARKADPLIRWCMWVGALSGMRLGEIVDAHARDVMEVDGYWVFHVGYEHRETTVKDRDLIARRADPLGCHPRGISGLCFGSEIGITVSDDYPRQAR
jgi:integrase